MKVLHDIFKNIEAAGSDKSLTIITGPGQTETITYRQLYSDCLYMLHNLRSHGLTEGSQIVMQVQADMIFVKVLWACILGKILPVPVTFGMGDGMVEKIDKIVKVLTDPYIISDIPGYQQRISETYSADFFSHLPDGSRRMLDAESMCVKTVKAEPSEVKPEDIAFLQFSSGSTSDPKGVMNSHQSILQNVFEMSDKSGITSEDTVLGWMPLTHDMGIIFFHMLPMFVNAHHYLIPPIVFMTHPGIWLESIAAYRATVSGSPNFGYAYYLKNCRGKTYAAGSFSHLRMLVNGAEQINYAVCCDFLNELAPYGMAGDVIRPTYGLAEATLCVSGQLTRRPVIPYWLNRLQLKQGDKVEFVDENDERALCFVNLGGFGSTQVEIRNAANEVLPDKTVGVIHIRGLSVTKGYFNNPEATGKLIDSEGWLNTGDNGFIIDGELVVVGREKEMIIYRGQNYYPYDIDYAVNTIPWVQDRGVAACGVYSERLRQDEVVVFIAYTGPLKNFIPGMQAVRKAVSSRMGIEVARVVPVPQLPKTTSGKIQRYKLREALLRGEYDAVLKEISKILLSEKPNQLTIPKTDVEKKIVAVIAERLQVETVNVRDNFFDMGANSMLIHAVKTELEEKFGLEIDEITLYKYPNVKALAGYINEKLAPAAGSLQPGRKAAFAMAKERLQRR